MTSIFDAAIHPSLWEAGLCYCPELKLSLVVTQERTVPLCSAASLALSCFAALLPRC